MGGWCVRRSLGAMAVVVCLAICRASALLETFGCTRRVTDAARLRFAQAPEPCQKRGKIGGVKRSLLAELDAFEVTSFDRRVERSSADTE